MSTIHPAWIGLGSNLGDSASTLVAAVEKIGLLNDLEIRNLSSLYRSEPWGRADQADFHNAVMAVATTMVASGLLKALLGIEDAMGRERCGPQWGPRIIDLDLLLFGDLVMASDSLTLPHPHMHLRRFVLAPLQEISPGLIIPGQGGVLKLLETLEGQGLERVGKLA